MSDHWLYSADLPDQPSTWTIEGPEAQHARAKHLAPAEPVHLFTGRGVVAGAEVIEAGRQQLTVRIHSLKHLLPRQPRLAVAVGQPKGERLDWMLEKLTELGVAAIWPLQCERSVAHPKDNRIDRWQRRLIEAAKQAHVAWLPTIEPSHKLPELLAQAGRFTDILVADTAPAALPILSAATTIGPQSQPIVLIGPEGGFTSAERDMMIRARARPVTLGPTVLRTETAAVVAAACLLCAADAR